MNDEKKGGCNAFHGLILIAVICVGGFFGVRTAYRSVKMGAFDAALSTTSTAWAPWYIVPADHKWVMRALVASIITGHIGAMDLAYPVQDDARHKLLKKALATLTEERKPGKRHKKKG